MITPETILLFFLFQFVPYGLPIVILIYALLRLRRDRQRALILLALAFAPVAHYAYRSFTDRVLAPQLRAAQVAAWPRKTMTAETAPKILIAPAWSIAKTLVGVGTFEKAYGPWRDQWYVYERTSNPGCPSRDEWQQYPGDRDYPKSTRCVAAATSDPPDVREPHLRLFFEEHAPSRHRPTEGVVSSSTLELRWSDGQRSQLVAFWERAYFNVPVFPPLLGPTGWFRENLHEAGGYKPRPDPRAFILEALRVGVPGPTL